MYSGKDELQEESGKVIWRIKDRRQGEIMKINMHKKKLKHCVVYLKPI